MTSAATVSSDNLDIFNEKIDHQVQKRRLILIVAYKKKQMSFLVDYKVEIKDSGKLDKYLYYARKEKIWNINVTMISITFEVLGRVPKNLEKKVPGELSLSRYPTHGRAKAGRPARTYIQQLCEDTGCCPEDLPRAMNDREEWRERVRDIRAASTIWWWWLRRVLEICGKFQSVKTISYYLNGKPASSSSSSSYDNRDES